jgi:hypothetical protein
MEWLAENWFWVLIGIVFVAMHLFGHGGHGGHGGSGCGHEGHEEHDSAGKPGSDTAGSEKSSRHRH